MANHEPYAQTSNILKCPYVPFTVLHYALQSNDEEFVKLILQTVDAKRDVPVQIRDHKVLKGSSEFARK